MRLRYKKIGTEWVPQYEKKGAWTNFTEDGLKDNAPELYKLVMKLRELQHYSCFYSNTKELFFEKEVLVMAFLGAAQFYFMDEAKDFEVFIDETK